MWPFQRSQRRLERALRAWHDPRAVRNRAVRCQAAKADARKCIGIVKVANPLDLYDDRTPAGACAGLVDLIHDYPDEYARYKYAPGGLEKLRRETLRDLVQKYKGGFECAVRPPTAQIRKRRSRIY
jgi:hypothetical protein